MLHTGIKCKLKFDWKLITFTLHLHSWVVTLSNSFAILQIYYKFITKIFPSVFFKSKKKRKQKFVTTASFFKPNIFWRNEKKKLPDFFIEAICFQYHFTHLFIILHVLFFMCLWQSWHVLWSFSIYLRWNWQFQFPSTVSSWNIDVRMCVFFFLLLMDAFVGKRGEIVMRLLE